MNKQFIRLAGILGLGLLAVVATAGTWSDNQFFYKPSTGARGTAEQSNFETGLTRVDAHLGKYKTLGDPNYSTLSEALTTIGSSAVTLTIPAGTVAVTSNTTIGGNIALRVLNGGKFQISSGVTLTINGPIEAGPYQIFAGSGSVLLGGVSTIYDVWFASPPATPEGSVAAPVGARFVKTSGSAPLIFVKESGSGTSGWVAASTLSHTHVPGQVGLGNVTNDAQLKRAAGDINSFPAKASPVGTDLILIEDSADGYSKKKALLNTLPGGGGAATFLGLSDTPSSYSGKSGKVVRVNAAENALEFGNADHAHSNQSYLEVINQSLSSTSSPTFAGLTINGNVVVSGTVDGVDVSNHKSRHEAGGPDAIAHQNLAGAGTYTHAQIDAHLTSTNNPHNVTAAQVGLGNVTNDAQLKRAAGDINSFTAKTSPVGSDLILIEDSADGYSKKKVQLSNLPAGVSTFVALNDTPASYSGQAGKALRVNSGETGLEFYTPSSSGGVKPYVILGEAGYGTLTEALATIGSRQTTLVIPAEAGAVVVSSNTTIGGNIRLKVENGAYFQLNDGVTLTITGPLEAGPYKIFQWSGSGKVVMTDSPTYELYLQWFGAQPGTSNNCAPALAKALETTVQNSKVIRLTRGLWRIASPVNFNKLWGVALVGEGVDNTGIYIDVGSGNNGLTFGNVDSGSSFQYRLENLSIVGPANGCKNALRFVRAHEVRIKNVNIYAGATDYAISFEGSIWGDLEVYIGHNYGYPLYENAARPTHGIAITRAADSYMANVLRLKVYATGLTNGIYIKDTLSGSGATPGYPIIISGSLEACSGYTIYGEKWFDGEIRDCYMTDLNQQGVYLKDSQHIRIINTVCYEDLYDPGLTLDNTRAVHVENGTYGKLVIKPSCRGTTLRNLQVRTALTDEAPDSVYEGGIWRRDSVPKTSHNSYAPTRRNYLTNSLFSRWQSDRPDGWDVNNLVWTKCGTGLADTTNHATDFSAKMTTSGGAANSYYYLNANQLKAVAGKVVNFTIWGKLASGQTFNNYPSAYIWPAVPTRASNTAYQVGEAVKPSVPNDRIYLCVTAGTTGGTEPTWPTTAEQTVTDGSVTWMCVYDHLNSWVGTPFGANDVGVWKRMTVAGFIPKNVTSVSLHLVLYRQASGSEATIYWAEPTLMTGWQGPDSVVQGQDEHADTVMVGANRITWGSIIPSNPSSPLYNQWAQRGDVHWNTSASAGGSPGWVCTTSGKNNVAAVWKPMANLGN